MANTLMQVNIDSELKDTVKAYCKRNGVSISEYVRTLIVDDLQDAGIDVSDEATDSSAFTLRGETFTSKQQAAEHFGVTRTTVYTWLAEEANITESG